MKYLKIIICSILVISNLNLTAQESPDWLSIVENELDDSGNSNRSKRKTNNLDRIMKSSKGGNSFSFMYLGPLLDAFNSLYLSTKDEKYLQYGYELVDNVLNSATMSKANNGYKTWYVSTNQVRYKEANNKEWMLFEGHFFRYVVQYLYLVDKNSDKIENREIVQANSGFIDFVHTNVWKKWYNASKKTRGDLTLLYGVRVHNGAHWATIAKHLEVLIDDAQSNVEFVSFYSSYDSWLRKNIRIDGDCYIWNSTWDTPFVKAHIERVSSGLDAKRVQDSAHGNHVLQYVISSYRLGNGWNEEDLTYFANTLMKRVLDSRRNLVFESIDGQGDSKYIDLSDGWFKLALYNKSVSNYLERFYKANNDRINASHQNLQFYSIGNML